MTPQEEKNQRYIKAHKRVEDIRKFYKHLFWFVLVNGFFIVRRMHSDFSHGDTLVEVLTDSGNYSFFFWWSIGLVLHGLSVFRFDFFLGKNWEERKVKEYMDQN